MRYSYFFIFVFLVLGTTLNGKIVYADPTGYTQIFPTITNGNEADFTLTDTYDADICPNGTGNSLAIRVYTGSYPDRTTLTTNGGYNSGTCFNTAWGWYVDVGTNPMPLEQNNANPFADGDYWLDIYSNLNPSFYTEFSISGGNATIIIPSTVPRIISFQPELGETEGSNTVTLETEIYNDSAEFVRFNLQNFDLGINYLPIDIPIGFSGGGTVSTTTILDTGFYFGNISMIGGNTQSTSSPTVSFIVVETEVSEGISLLPLATTTESMSLISQLQRLFIAQDSGILLRQGISELYLELNTKLPFGFFTLIKDKIQTLADTGASEQNDVVINLDGSFVNGTTTIFSWSGAKNFFDDVIPVEATNVIIYVEWIFTSCIMAYISIKLLI